MKIPDECNSLAKWEGRSVQANFGYTINVQEIPVIRTFQDEAVVI